VIKRASFQTYWNPFLGEGLRLIGVSNFEEGKKNTARRKAVQCPV
jgi:hypothetical protein